ncbi:unnamed protein product [Phaeothamnion confervicola]
MRIQDQGDDEDDFIPVQSAGMASFHITQAPREPKPRPPRPGSVLFERPSEGRMAVRTCILGACLLLLGLSMLLTALTFWRKGHDGSLAFLLLGIFATLPGCYAMAQTLDRWRRGQNLNYESV